MSSCERTKKFYKSRNGMIFGVCQGIADWKGINVGYIRLTLVILTIFTGFFPFGLLYLMAAFFLPVEPVYRKRHSYTRSSVKRGFYDMKQEFDDLASRFNGMERDSTHKERDWDSRFQNG
ncbi:MAG: PspC domain-containing protein [Spirochaetaceae bacterium]|jgi:phage shock protein C|nr:PspC domain-containing protein [Spirochaetaceae bacterium]